MYFNNTVSKVIVNGLYISHFLLWNAYCVSSFVNVMYW